MKLGVIKLNLLKAITCCSIFSERVVVFLWLVDIICPLSRLVLNDGVAYDGHKQSSDTDLEDLQVIPIWKHRLSASASSLMSFLARLSMCVKHLACISVIAIIKYHCTKIYLRKKDTNRKTVHSPTFSRANFIVNTFQITPKPWRWKLISMDIIMVCLFVRQCGSERSKLSIREEEGYKVRRAARSYPNCTCRCHLNLCKSTVKLL